MNLLAARFYEPASVVNKSTASLLAMTAFDTTNLRLTVTVPSHGNLYIRIKCSEEGAATFPQVLLGVMQGAVTLARMQPDGGVEGTFNTTTRMMLDAEFVLPGLTPGPITLDAAYSVEVQVGGTAIKYGGPNDTVLDNAYGGITFEVWDPAPPNNFVSTTHFDTVIGIPVSTVSADIAAIPAGNAPQFTFKRNAASPGFTFPLITSDDHISGLLGAVVTGRRCKDGSPFTPCSNSIVEISDGFYKIDLSADDLNAGVVSFLFTAPNADPQRITVLTQP